jgi:hypothetical protein
MRLRTRIALLAAGGWEAIHAFRGQRRKPWLEVERAARSVVRLAAAVGSQ